MCIISAMSALNEAGIKYEVCMLCVDEQDLDAAKEAINANASSPDDVKFLTTTSPDAEGAPDMEETEETPMGENYEYGTMPDETGEEFVVTDDVKVKFEDGEYMLEKGDVIKVVSK